MNETGAWIVAGAFLAVGAAADIALIAMCAAALKGLHARNRRGNRRARSPQPLRAARGGWRVASLLAATPAIAAAQPAAVSSPSPGNAAPATQDPATETDAALVIGTDRPGFSDTAGIVQPGHLQVETGYTFTFRDRAEVETHRHNAPEILARIGLLDDRLEFRFLTSGYVWSRTDDGSGAGFNSADGFSDVAFGFKLKLIDQDGAIPRLALGAQSTIGVGARDISSLRAEPTAKLIWSYDFQKLLGDDWKGFTLYGNLNLAFPTTGGDRFAQGAGSVYAIYALTDTVSVFAEYFVVGPASKGSREAHSVNVGATWLLNSRLQLDARIGAGLNDEADNLSVGAGLSILF